MSLHHMVEKRQQVADVHVQAIIGQHQISFQLMQLEADGCQANSQLAAAILLICVGQP